MKLPNLELLEYKAKQAFFSTKKNTVLYRAAQKKFGGLGRNPEFRVEVFPQTWGSTCLGFDVNAVGEPMYGGQAMTDAYTTVFLEPLTETYLVFFGDDVCYQVQNATETFLKDFKNHKLRPLSEAKQMY